MSSIFQHYWELIQRYRRMIGLIVAVATLGTAILSVAQLQLKPRYTAVARLILLPTAAEVAFARGGGGSSAQILAKTHLEYLMSRTVARSVLDKMREESAQAAKRKGRTSSALSALVGRAMAFVSRSMRILNSGTFVPLPPEEAALAQLRAGTDVIAVPGSYIMEISVELPSPKTATFAANTLADAYVVQATAELERSAGEIGGFLDQELARVEELQAGLVSQEQQLRLELGLQDLENELQRLSGLQESLRRSESEAQVALRAQETELEQLRLERARATRAEIAAILERDITLKETQLQGLRAGIEQRVREMSAVERDMAQLLEKEEPLRAIRTQRESVERDLKELRARSFDVVMARSSTLNRVRIIDPALEPVYPSSPQVLNQTVTAALMGLLLGLLLVAAIDTFSGSIKTTVDLKRLAGGRTLGKISQDLVAYATEAGVTSQRRSGRLAEVGSEIERRLAMEGSMDAPSLQVTGFLPEQRLADATVTLALALAEQGREVVCVVAQAEHYTSAPISRPRAGSLQLLAVPPSGDLHPGAAVAGSSRGGAIRVFPPQPVPARAELTVVTLPPLSAAFRYREAADRSPSLICMLPAGRISPDEVEDFQSRARECGLAPVTFLLLDA